MTSRRAILEATRRALFLGALALALLVGGCGGRTASQGEAGAQASPVEYKLQPNDELAIAVFGQKDLSGKFTVDSDGNLMLPLVGQLSAAGQTATQVQDSLSQALKAYLVNPRVTVQVASFRPFYILGEVNKPGSYPYSPGITVRQGVATAGGYTKRARTGTVEVFHSGQSDKDAVEASDDYQLQPGDTVQVERRLF